jgi:hypothetical protein
MATVIPTEKYFVEFIDGSSPFFMKNAVSFKDMIIHLADYTGSNCDLFIKALKGMVEVEDMVAIYNMFSSYEIDRVFKVEEIVYER